MAIDNTSYLGCCEDSLKPPIDQRGERQVGATRIRLPVAAESV